MKKGFGSTLKISLAIMLSFLTSNFMPVMTAYATEDVVVIDQTCDDITTPGSKGWTAKFDDGYPDTVQYTAPAGYVVDQYCVKAGSTQQGNGPLLVPVNPHSSSVTIDYPGIDSISHYVVHLVPATQTIVSPVAPSVTDMCGTAGDVVIAPVNSVQITYSVSGSVVTATLVNPLTHDFGVPLNGYVVATNGLTATFTASFTDNAPCATVPIPVPAGVVSLENPCGTANDKLIIPTTANVTYSIGGVTIAAGTHLASSLTSQSGTVVATANTGYVLTTAYSFEYAFTNTSCGVVLGDSTDVTLCHATGSESKPFVRITVSAAGAANGHYGEGRGDHQDGEDIIPEFVYEGIVYPAQNLGEGETINEKCDVEEVETVFVPVVAVITLPCVAPGTSTGQITVKVTNPNSFDIDFELKLKNSLSVLVKTQDVMVGANSSQTVTLTGFAAGQYSLELWAANATTLEFLSTTSLTLENCVVTPGQGGGQVQGTSTTRGATTTTTTPQVLGTQLPASLPATGVEANINMFYALLATIATYGAVYFLQGRRQLQN